MWLLYNHLGKISQNSIKSVSGGYIWVMNKWLYQYCHKSRPLYWKGWLACCHSFTSWWQILFLYDFLKMKQLYDALFIRHDPDQQITYGRVHTALSWSHRLDKIVESFWCTWMPPKRSDFCKSSNMTSPVMQNDLYRKRSGLQLYL